MTTNFNKTNTSSKQENTRSGVVKAGVLCASLLGSLMMANSVSAVSACKGLDNSACGAAASCGWVESYQRKDGRTVKAFCRTKSRTKSRAKSVGKSASAASKKSPTTLSTKNVGAKS